MTFTNQLSAISASYLALETPQKHTWCSGCGNYGILNALMDAIALEGFANHEIILANDVGCNGNVSDKIQVNTIHGLHGRVLPLASGIHCARPDIPVIAMAGDGATLSEGINHLIHTARNNYNITFILHNNHNYGLTTGQASSTTPKGYSMNAAPGETNTTPLIPAQLVLSAGGTFVARGYSGNIEQLVSLIRSGINHRGFSFIEVMQLCPTYSKATSDLWYDQRIYDIATRDDYDTTNKRDASRIAEDFDHIATGILYQDTTAQDFYSLQLHRNGLTTTPTQETKRTDISSLLEHFGCV